MLCASHNTETGGSYALSPSFAMSIFATDRDDGRSGAVPCADDTIVSVQLGEAVGVAKDRPVIATISDRRRNATVRAMHAERRIPSYETPRPVPIT